ncbi:MAG TPA: diaminopimelate epimerase [Candidatus Choladousia intestinipullorum]|nr:diaminopimelate epimerase [Candidatus Choladousia intestinipullorum]
MKFTKMHGIGNDYVYVNCLREHVERPKETAVAVSDRHFGIGSDGLILIKPSDCADFEMEMYNADGSRGAMCGNGIRCVAKYVYDYGLTDKEQISVATGSGIKQLDLTVENGKVSLVKVDMGSPILEAEKIPARRDYFGEKQEQGDQRIIAENLAVQGRDYEVTCVSMGNPHCITCVDDVDGLEIEQIGPDFENHPAFPDRVNTEFIRVIDRNTVQMRVWERGSGETWACGTGACAVAVACILNGWTEDTVTVKLRGGDLDIFWDRQKNTVFMTGPAVTVFDGEIDLADFIGTGGERDV